MLREVQVLHAAKVAKSLSPRQCKKKAGLILYSCDYVDLSLRHNI